LKMPPELTRWSYVLPALRPQVPAWVQRRAELQADLKKKASADGTLSLTAAGEALQRIGEVKWSESRPGAAIDLQNWTGHVQNDLAGRHWRGVKPVIFVEYLWGPDQVDALCWTASNPVRAQYVS